MDTSVENSIVQITLGDSVFAHEEGLNHRRILNYSCFGGLGTEPLIDFVEKEFQEQPFVFEAKPSKLHKYWNDRFAWNTPTYVISLLEQNYGEKTVSFMQQHGVKVVETSVHAFQSRTYIVVYESGNGDYPKPRIALLDLMYHVRDIEVGEREMGIYIPSMDQLVRLFDKDAWSRLNDAIVSRYNFRANQLHKATTLLNSGMSEYRYNAGYIKAILAK